VGRHSKEIEPTAEGAPLGSFLRRLQTASGMTWRQLGAASHTSHTTLSQGADGHLASRWDTVEQWLRAFYSAVRGRRVDGYNLEEALTYAHELWRYCHECARLGKPPIDDDTDFPTPGHDPLGGTIVMEIREVDGSSPSSTGDTNAERTRRPVPAQPAAAVGRKVGLHNLHEARSAAEFLGAIEDARAAAGLPWTDLIGFLFESAQVATVAR
jgi:hypothetical protein